MAKSSPNIEVCGFIYCHENSISIYPCKNISLTAQSDDPDFEIDDQDYISCSQIGEICGIYHSHVKEPDAFSEADIDLANTMALPVYLYCLPTSAWRVYIPENYTYDLVGIPFCWGEHDCFSLVRDYYRMNRQVYLTDYDRDESFENSDTSIILDSFVKEGFKEISLSEIEVGDMIVFNTKRYFPQHLAIFIGNSKILHHPLGRLSSIDPIDESWFKKINMVLRYVGKTGV